jgi:hypothetical protein
MRACRPTITVSNPSGTEGRCAPTGEPDESSPLQAAQVALRDHAEGGRLRGAAPRGRTDRGLVVRRPPGAARAAIRRGHAGSRSARTDARGAASCRGAARRRGGAREGSTGRRWRGDLRRRRDRDPGASVCGSFPRVLVGRTLLVAASRSRRARSRGAARRRARAVVRRATSRSREARCAAPQRSRVAAPRGQRGRGAIANVSPRAPGTAHGASLGSGRRRRRLRGPVEPCESLSSPSFSCRSRRRRPPSGTG